MWAFKFKPLDTERAFLLRRTGMKWSDVSKTLHRRNQDVIKATQYYHTGSTKKWKKTSLAGIAKIKERAINKYGFDNEEEYLDWLDEPEITT